MRFSWSLKWSVLLYALLAMEYSQFSYNIQINDEFCTELIRAYRAYSQINDCHQRNQHLRNLPLWATASATWIKSKKSKITKTYHNKLDFSYKFTRWCGRTNVLHDPQVMNTTFSSLRMKTVRSNEKPHLWQWYSNTARTLCVIFTYMNITIDTYDDRFKRPTRGNFNFDWNVEINRCDLSTRILYAIFCAQSSTN